MPKVKSFNETAALQKAMEVFWNKGYNGSSMDELTIATGLSRSSLYNTFGSKHGLFMQCLQHYRLQQQQALLQAVAGITSPLQKIQTAFRWIVQVILDDLSRNGCLVVNTTAEMSNHNGDIASFIVDNREGFEQLFAVWIQEAQHKGEISAAFTPRALARHLFNSYSGLRVSGKAMPEKAALEEIVAIALSCLNRV